MFEATRLEYAILSKEFEFSRRYFLEQLITWYQSYFDSIGFNCSEKYYLFVETLFDKQPVKLKSKECWYTYMINQFMK